MTSHNPRPLDQFLKKLPDGVRIETQYPRARLDDATLEWLRSRAELPLEPWQKEVLQRHPAFRHHRQDPAFLRLTHRAQIRPRGLWSRLLRRLRIR